jgi:hypothetical protein
VSSLYRQVPSYTALYDDNSMVTKRPFRRGVPSYMALYLALPRKEPPHKPLTLLAQRPEKGQLSDHED